MYVDISISYTDTDFTEVDVFTVNRLDIGWMIQPESVGLIGPSIVLVNLYYST